MIKNYLKTAWRSLFKQKGISLINIIGLSTGMVAAILIFLWVQNELNFDNYHKDARDIYRITSYLNTDEKEPLAWETSPFLLGEEIKKQVPEALAVARILPMYEAKHVNIKGEFSEEKRCAYIDSQWLQVFHYDFISGNATAFNSSPFSMLLTASVSKKYFGNENAVGKTIRIDTIDYIVQGVLKDNPANSSFQYDVLIPQAARSTNPRAKKSDTEWGNYGYLTFVKLLPSADPGKTAKKIAAIFAKARDGVKVGAGLNALSEMHFDKTASSSQLLRGDKKMVTIFSVLGVLLLAIACINYVNLTTARASMRVKEVSIKKIVGANRQSLFAQFIMESALVSLIALLIALLALGICLPYFNQFTEKNFVISYSSLYLWTILGGTFLSAVALTSIYPALLLSSFKPLSIFRGAGLFKFKDGLLRKSLVVVQFSISVILIVSTIVVYQQMKFINRQNSAYERSQLFSFSIPFEILRKYEGEKRQSLTSSIKRELMLQSTVTDVSLMNMRSVVNMQGGSSGGSNDWDGRNKDYQPMIAFFEADTSLKGILNLEMKEGRWFLPGNSGDAHNSILNETAVREFNIKRPVIGQRFTSRGDTGVIVGVVRDFYYKTLHEKIGPAVIRNVQDYNSTYLVKTSPGKTMEAKAAAEATWKKFFPADPFSCKFMNEEFEALYRADNKAATLVWIFSFLAILISCLGLYGLAAFTAERRGKEIGIRKVLGASVSGIVRLLSTDFLKLIFIAILIASPIAWLLMNKWLQEFAYRINIAWWMFLSAGAIALIIAFVSIGVRAIKAAVTNPTKSLRTE